MMGSRRGQANEQAYRRLCESQAVLTDVLPALEAHTRLLFGRYLEYRVTEKV